MNTISFVLGKKNNNKEKNLLQVIDFVYSGMDLWQEDNCSFHDPGDTAREKVRTSNGLTALSLFI